MCEPVTTALLIASTATSFVGSMQQARFQKNVSKYNAAQQRNEATQVQNQGIEAENAKRRETAQLIGRQRAAAGASGINVDSGSVAQLQDDTAILGEVDALRIRSNTERQANSMSESANLTIMDGANKARASTLDAFGSVLSGAATVAQVNSKWLKPDSQGS